MSQQRKISGFGRIALLFSCLPIFVLSLVGNYSLSRFNAYFEKTKTDLMEKKLDAGVAACNRDYFLYSRIEPLIQILRAYGPECEELNKIYNELLAKWGITLKVYFYKNFSFARSLPSNAPFSESYGKILQAITFSGPKFYQARRDLKPDIDKTLDTRFLLNDIKRWEGSFTYISGTKGTFFLQNFPDGYGIFVSLLSYPQGREMFKMIPEAARKNLGIGFLKEDVWITPKTCTQSQMRLAWEHWKSQKGQIVRLFGYNWAFCQARSAIVWCYAQKDEANFQQIWVASLIWGGYIFSAVLFIGFLLAFFETSICNFLVKPINSLSIRIQLIALFLMASILPLGMGVILSSIAILDRQEILFMKANQESNKIILKFERSYHALLEKFKQFCIHLRDSSLVKEARTNALASAAYEFLSRDEVQQLEIRDGAGKTIYSTWDPVVDGTSWITEQFSKMAIKRHAPNRLTSSLKKVSVEDVVTDSLMASVDSGMTVPMKYPGKVWLIKMGGGSAGIWFWDVYTQLSSGPAFIFVVSQIGWMYRDYILKTFDQFKEGDYPLIGAIETKWRKRFITTFPFLEGPELETLIQVGIRSNMINRTMYREIELKQGRFLL
ncbi:hypothetical protein HYY75_04650, partial [bacterium]|nr:hypothetical protein [bacterium]